LLSGSPLSRLSFRWQIILLGTLVVVLSLAVLLAIGATLRYTKSAVLKTEKDRLTQTTRNLAEEYEEKAANLRRNHQPPLLGDSTSPTSQDVLALLSRVVVQNVSGAGGGYYSSARDSLIGSYFPSVESPLGTTGTGGTAGATWGDILAAARSAASSDGPTSKAISNAPGIVLIEAVPLRDGYSVVGSAWTVKWLPDVPGANRFRAYLITAGLGATALASVLLTLLVIRNLLVAVRKIQSGLKSLEASLDSEIRTADDPREIQQIMQAIDRLRSTLQEKIEHEKKIENQLRHTERLASLGRLVAGVAHEVRNPLTTIRLRVQMCERDSESARVRESCSIALQEIERLNGMVNRLLSFARPVQLNLAPVDLQGLVEERMSSFAELALRCRVAFVTDFFDQSITFVVDRNRMAQVFDNIIQNAIEAMSERGGTLSVTMASHKQVAGDGSGVSMEFRDTGKGMNASIIDHVFDPFFTTKTSGTGLGLSICHELVRAHGGDIYVESEEGQGTCVRVTIPASRTASATTAARG
jgi:signal transduction histidine kinase